MGGRVWERKHGGWGGKREMLKMGRSGGKIKEGDLHPLSKNLPFNN
jgi:hypothetical protein